MALTRETELRLERVSLITYFNANKAAWLAAAQDAPPAVHAGDADLSGKILHESADEDEEHGDHQQRRDERDASLSGGVALTKLGRHSGTPMF